MAESTAFSSSGEDAISRVIAVEPDGPSDLSEQNLFDYFEIQRTVDEINKGDYKRIGLQFPDELLHESVPIYRLLKSRLNPKKELYVLADTSYGSCCVDEVAAQHVDADAMVHYGHACMSQTSRLPVVYVFGKRTIDARDCLERLAGCLNAAQSQHETVLLKMDVAYAHVSEDIVGGLKTTLPPSMRLLWTPLPLKGDPVKAHDGPGTIPTTPSSSSDENAHSIPSAPILYVGGESLALTNLLMTHSLCDVYSYDPLTKTARTESAKTNRLLMRRYAAVQKARDADVYGILVGTLGIAAYLPLISHLRSILKKAQKKSYTISVGKLNPTKLANFLEIECFVIVACPENSVIEAKEFLRPIVTPYELEIALESEPDWTGKYVLDFKEILSSQKNEADPSGEVEPVDMDQPVFSLVTGKYRHAKRYGAATDAPEVQEDSSALTLRNQDNALSVMSDSASAHFLQSRTYRGLETRIGKDAPSILEQGRSGIARGYQDDHR